MNVLTTEELLYLRKLLYKGWLLSPVYDDTSRASNLMDDIDLVLKERHAWVPYEFPEES